MRWPIRRTLESASIPAPSMLMAQMLALRIDKLPADYSSSGGSMRLLIPVRGGSSRIEVSVDAEMNVYWSNNRHYARVRVGMMGPDPYRNVELTREEQLIVADAAYRLHARTTDLRSLEREADSQQNALVILENLL